MATKRMIVILATNSGEIYEIDKEYNGYVVGSIVFNQNGFMSINQGAGPAYLVTLKEPIAGKVTVSKLIPYGSTHDVTFVDIEEDNTESSETPTDMKRA